MFEHHMASWKRIREGAFTAEDLDTEPGLAEVTLALALASYKAEDRRQIKARIKRIKHPVLVRLLKALPRRNYDAKPARIVEDCESVVAPDGGLSATVFAYYVSEVTLGNRKADQYIAENASPAELRSMLPALITSGGGEAAYIRITQPWPAATLDWLAALDTPITGFTVTLAEPGSLPTALARQEALGSIRVDGEHALMVADGVLPMLSSLRYLRAPVTRVPADIGEAKGLENLTLRGSFTELPDLTGLTRLEELSVRAPLECMGALPPTLKKLSLSGLCCPLPESLGGLPSLQEVSISRMHLEALPSGWIGREGLNLSQYKLTTGDALGGAARRALGLPGTDSLTDRFDLFLEPFADIIPLPEAGGVARPEVLVAISRTYIDVEHGADTNDHLVRTISDLGGPIEAAASAALRRVIHIRDEASLTDALQRLDGQTDFDAGVFEDAVRAILGSEWHRARVGEWF